MQPSSSVTSVSPDATTATPHAFPWSRTQAATLLTRFITSALAASVFAALVWLAPQQTTLMLAPLGLLTASELAGLALCTVDWRDYGWRALSRGAEIWPSLAAACLEPAAVLGGVILVVYALIASGVHTVALSRGTATGRVRGEGARRVVVFLANAGFIAFASARTQGWTLEQTDPRTLVWVALALTLIASARAAVDITYWARSGT